MDDDEDYIGEGRDSPTDWDEYEMNADDCAPDPADLYDIEYDR
jgi:hypothetical protein